MEESQQRKILPNQNEVGRNEREIRTESLIGLSSPEWLAYNLKNSYDYRKKEKKNIII